MRELGVLIGRNVKLFFKDKAMFFTALITPMILLVLYATFLGNVYRDSVMSALPEGVEIEKRIIDGFVGGQLLSSLLSVCTVTVAFCSNMLMVQDKLTGAGKDLSLLPVRSSAKAISYYVATFFSTLIVCLAAYLVGLCYLAVVGWYVSAADVCFMLLDVFLLVAFGTAFSSIVNCFLSTQGQISAVGTVVSAGYGFICGAYMPISQFGAGLRGFVSLLPGTYGTSLMRNHALRGALKAMTKDGTPAEATNAIRKTMDCDLSFFGSKVSVGAMYAVLVISVIALIAAFVAVNFLSERKKKN